MALPCKADLIILSLKLAGYHIRFIKDILFPAFQMSLFRAEKMMRIQPVCCADKAGGEWRCRMAVDNFRRVILLDDATGEDRDAIAHGHRFDLIVGDKDSGHMEACNEIADFASHFLSELRIKRRKRLIKENAVLAVGKGAGKGYALLLSA